MSEWVHIPEQECRLDDLKWSALNTRYPDPVPSMEAVSVAVEAVVDALTNRERSPERGAV